MKEATAALKLALEALEKSTKYFNIVRLGESRLKDTEIRGASHAAIIAIKEALTPTSTQCEVQPEQKPLAFISPGGHIHYDPYLDSVPLYTTPPKRPWVGLTDEGISSVLSNLQVMYNRPPTTDSRTVFAKAIEAKLKEKNT